jgi:uncharacterized repeat protein (TIGR01451 family)
VWTDWVTHGRRLARRLAIVAAIALAVATAMPGSGGAAQPGADLVLEKAVSNSTPNVGDTITFTVALANAGPLIATNVQVTDLIPAGLSFVAATVSQGSYDPFSGLWSVGTALPGLPQTLQLTATVASPKAQKNKAKILHSDQPDPRKSNNSASVTETPQQADLGLTKKVSDRMPNVGDQVTFTVTLSNKGPDAATNARVVDVLPAGLTLMAATPSQGTYASFSGLWTVGTVIKTTPQTLQLLVLVVSPNAMTNTAVISHSDQFDRRTGNNVASAAVTPQNAELAITKKVDNTTPAVGSLVTFTVTLKNNGPSAATNVEVADFLPAGLVLVSAKPSHGTYSSGFWAVGTVKNRKTVTLRIVADVVSPTVSTNTATISHSDQFDPVTLNNSASATIVPQ